MSGFALLEVQRALYTKLSGDGVLMGMIQGVHDAVPQNTAYPYLVLGDSTQKERPADALPVNECTIDLYVVTHAAGRKEALTIMSRVQALLHMGILTVSGFAVVMIRVEQSSIEVVEQATVVRGMMRVVLTVVGA